MVNKASSFPALLRPFSLCLTMMMNLPCLKGSCPNFLRSTYSYTECQPSSLTVSMPMVKTGAGYSSCFYLIDTDRASSYTGTDWFSGRFPVMTFSGLCDNCNLMATCLRVAFSRTLPSRRFCPWFGRALDIYVSLFLVAFSVMPLH